jgi:hypothetical protein
MGYEVISGEVVAVFITVVLPLILNYIFKWSKRHGITIDKEQEEYIINAATNGALTVWDGYTSNIKKYSIDGKLDKDEKEKARNEAIEKAKSIITKEFKKAYKRGNVDKLVEGAMENVYSNVKGKFPEANANAEVLDAVHMGLKITMRKYTSVLKKSVDEGKFEEKKTWEIIEEVLEISKEFMTKEIRDRINENKAESKDRVNRIILREMYKMLLSEEESGTSRII